MGKGPIAGPSVGIGPLSRAQAELLNTCLLCRLSCLLYIMQVNLAELLRTSSNLQIPPICHDSVSSQDAMGRENEELVGQIQQQKW